MKKYSIHEYFLFFLWFPLCRGKARHYHVRLHCNLFPLVPVVGLFSPLFFLLCLFQISLHTLLSCGLPSFLQPSCFFLSDLFRNLSSFILTMYIHTYGRIKYSLLLHIPVIASVTRIPWSGIRPNHGDSTMESLKDRPWAQHFLAVSIHYLVWWVRVNVCFGVRVSFGVRVRIDGLWLG